LDTDSGKYEGLWLTNPATTRGWVYAFGSFAILSLRFPLIPATGADFLVEIRECDGQTGEVQQVLPKLLS
jgi:hypothetical protein